MKGIAIPGKSGVRKLLKRSIKDGRAVVSPGKVAVVHGREAIARCQKCGADSWHVIAEVRREEFDDPKKIKSQAMRMVCTKCHKWVYIEQVMKPATPRVITRKYVNGHPLSGKWPSGSKGPLA